MPSKMRNCLKLCLAACVVMALSLMSLPAQAASCGFTAIAGLSFGSYDVFGPNADTAGSISYSCSGVLPGDVVRIDLSIGGAPSYFPRQMQSGVHRLNYNIYLDASRTVVWGDGSGGSSTYGPLIPADGAATTVNSYGRIPAGQDAYVGTYTDTIIVTMTY
ncbi:MAG: spore coat protein U domain-containing protein [Myxococcales bacterium]|nr:MAG: spore coat protein U domain-containing protein [Myxococcales bacterium]